MDWALAIVALVVLVIAGLSRRLSGTPVTASMVFVAIGILLGPEVLGEVGAAPSSETVRVLAEATLTVVLFSDASRIKLDTLRRELGVPARLLGLGLPLTIAFGAVAAALVFHDMTIGEVVILAVLLAPTDAALGQAVVTQQRLPLRIRQGLNVESGLNDGICVPLLLVALAVAEAEASIGGGHAATVLVEELGYGILGGLIAGLLTTAIVVYGRRRGLLTPSWTPIIPIAGAALAYGTAVPLGGSGFIGAFVGGLIFGAFAHAEAGRMNRVAEEIGELLSGLTFLMFGAVLLGPELGRLTWQVVLYAVMSLTVIRMVPVAIAMLGSGARPATVAFLGWFGPRGLASIVFAAIVIESSHLPQAPAILLATYLTVGLSVFLHGLSAAPLADRYGRWYERHPPGERPPMESVPVEVHRQRTSSETG